MRPWSQKIHYQVPSPITMKLSNLILLLAVLPAALAAGNNSFPIKRSNKPISDLALAAPRAILPSNSGMFYVQLGIGTPAFDTVSPMTWLQVPERELCFPVDEGGSFDPNHSSTFTLLSSGDPMCSPPLGIPLSNGSCDYNLGYSKGFFSTDILSYSVDDAAATEVSLNVSFGCGLFNQLAFGGDDESRNPISGVMGLGLGHPSGLLTQLRSVMMDRFSYCIPPLFPIEGDLQEGKDATLDFGPEAVLTGAVQSSRLLEQPPLLYHHYYLINVTGIMVNGDLCRRKDSLSALTRFLHTLQCSSRMQELRDVVVKHFMDKYGMAPLNQTQSGLELCYELQKYEGRTEFLSRGPAVVLRLEGGAPLELQNASELFEDEGCLTIISVDDDGSMPNLLGVHNHMTYRFQFELDDPVCVEAARSEFDLCDHLYVMNLMVCYYVMNLCDD